MSTGAIQPEFQERLRGMGAWLRTNGESVYGTERSPFRSVPFGRCTTQGSKLYLHIFDWNARPVTLERLETPVRRAYYLHNGERIWATQQDGTVRLHLTGDRPDPIDTVVVLELAGPPQVDTTIRANAEGVVPLAAAEATVHGSTARYEGLYDDIGFWTVATDWVSWDFAVEQPGTYDVVLTYACANDTPGSEFEVSVGDQKVTGTIEATGGWGEMVTRELGAFTLAAGKHTLAVKATKMPGFAVMNLRSIVLRPR
jgi:alpha-L-fucosidase